MKRGTFLYVEIAALCGWLAWACAYSIAAQSPANWKTDWQATLSAAEKEEQLVIYGPRGRDQ